MDNSDWKKAENHLSEIQRQYGHIGAAGIPALMLTIGPIATRYEKGERTQELYDKIMGLK